MRSKFLLLFFIFGHCFFLSNAFGQIGKQRMESVLTEYMDLRSGRSLIVSGKTPQLIVFGWLEKVNDAQSENDLSKLVASYRAQGLLSASLPPSNKEVIGAQTIVRSEYRSLRWGHSIVVLGGVSQPTAVEWASDVNKSSDVATLTELVNANHAHGLLGIKKIFSGTLIFVSKGIIREKTKGESSLTLSSTDPRTGRSVITTDNIPEGKDEAWLSEVNKAEGEADLNKLVRTNHSQGFIGAVMVIEIGREDYKITTTWKKGK